MPKANKFSTLKQEADIYLSQGLHQEAIELIGRFLSDNPNLGQHTISALEKWINLIQSTIYSSYRDEKELLSEVEISLLKKGWYDSATDDERLTSAGALLKLGYYHHALDEYQRLLAKRCMNAAVFKGAAMCLVHLHQPEKFAAAVDGFAKIIFNTQKNRHACIVNIARCLGSDRYPRHFSVLFNHLAKISLGSDPPRL